MTEYVLRFMKELEFDSEAIESLYSDLLKVYSNSEARDLFEQSIHEYTTSVCLHYTPFIERADKAAELVGIHKYSAELLLYLCFSKHLKEMYIENGIDTDIFYNSMLNLKWKLLECKAVKGIWGSFVVPFLKGYFNLTSFALGRLQFEIIKLKYDYSKDGKTIKSGSNVINVHIPRTLTPLDKESCDKAYALAREFFKDKIGDNTPMAFVCHSWLLFPPYIELLNEKSNVYRFAKDFDVININYENEGEYPNAWRLFDMDYTGNIEDYPENTSLRKAIKDYMRSGKRTGEAFGIFFA